MRGALPLSHIHLGIQDVCISLTLRFEFALTLLSQTLDISPDDALINVIQNAIVCF